MSKFITYEDRLEIELCSKENKSFTEIGKILKKDRITISKEKSFDELSQEDVNKMMDHINSYKRKKLNDKSTYESFSFHYGEAFLKRLGCQKFPPIR